MKDLTILKLGGSILTLKEQNRAVFRKKLTNRLVLEIKKALTETKGNIIIIHGTGSFGHPPAHKYKLALGIKADYSGMGFSISKRQGFKLNNLIWEVFENHNLPLASVPPYLIALSNNGIIQKMNLRLINTLLKINRIPLLFGDEVIDKTLGYSICSSDQIAAYLAVKLNAKRLLFASDTDGIYTKNPKQYKNAKRLNSIKLSDIKLYEVEKKHNLMDVSGEMKGKLESLNLLSQNPKIEVRIFSGIKKNNIYKALIGKNIGTLILSTK